MAADRSYRVSARGRARCPRDWCGPRDSARPVRGAGCGWLRCPTNDRFPRRRPRWRCPDRTGGFVALLGLEFDEVSADRVVIRWRCRPELHQPYGIQHGGVYSSVVETAASVGAACCGSPTGAGWSGGCRTRPTSSARYARVSSPRWATPVHRGRTQQLWQVEITDEAGAGWCPAARCGCRTPRRRKPWAKSGRATCPRPATRREPGPPRRRRRRTGSAGRGRGDQTGLVGGDDQLRPVPRGQLASSRPTWVLTVATLSAACAAISALDRPRATATAPRAPAR